MNKLLWQKAKEFINDFYIETGKPCEEAKKRLKAVQEEINQTGTYSLETEELEYGAKLAWRNSNRCIGRLFWQTLHVFDERDAKTEEDIFSALERHIIFAGNEGKVRPAITIFRPSEAGKEDVRIWNHQLLRYAGYEKSGDPHSRIFTKKCESLGWRGKGGQFDFLPWVIQIGERPPVWKEVPQHCRTEVDIRHADFNWFEELQLKWYTIPLISDMKLEIGGIEFKAAPFNGWYMGTEIGTRNFADEERYNLLPAVAEKMKIDMSHASALWKDRALIELNAAVLFSFKEQGVTIVDHHTAARQHRVFEQNEAAAGRRVTGDWSWLIPPVSPSTTHVFHRSYENVICSPNFFYQEAPYHA